jgi:transposase InsO family protein
MAREVVPMDVRLRIAVASNEVNVAAFCRQHGLSRETFYVWRRRFEADGFDGLEPRSRAPKTSPQRIGGDVEEAIVALRKELGELGVDAGPGTIQWHLRQQKRRAVPSEATIWRVLMRRGFVTPEPRKRPRSSWRRFEASAPNELWQADCIDWVIATGPVRILSFLDDHSRVALRVAALTEATTDATWLTFCEASEVWGIPLGQLTDNGLNFSGRLRGFEVRFEIELRAIGVIPKTSRPHHPQTCGKVERFQQTLKKWLRRQPLAADLAELQAQLDTFVAYYNHQRPHRGIGRRTPAQARAATPTTINLGVALPGPAHATTVVVDDRGILRVSRYRIAIGVEHARRTARIHHDDTHAAVFIDHQLVRALTLDPTRSYQPSNRPPGGPRRTRLP